MVRVPSQHDLQNAQHWSIVASWQAHPSPQLPIFPIKIDVERLDTKTNDLGNHVVPCYVVHFHASRLRLSSWACSSATAEFPARLGHRGIGRPTDGSSVSAVRRAIAAIVLDTADSQLIVTRLSVESLSRQCDITEELDHALLRREMNCGFVWWQDTSPSTVSSW